MKILVMGTGGIGGYFGAKLCRAGEAVMFVARGAHLEAIRKNGLRIQSAADGDFVQQCPTLAITATRIDTIKPQTGEEQAAARKAVDAA